MYFIEPLRDTFILPKVSREKADIFVLSTDRRNKTASDDFCSVIDIGNVG